MNQYVLGLLILAVIFIPWQYPLIRWIKRLRGEA
jgi:hypothetical protein